MKTPATSLVETTRADETAEAIRRGFGYKVALSTGELSYRQRVIVGDQITVSDLHLGAVMKLDLDPTDQFMFVAIQAGSYEYNPWGVQHVIGAGGSFVMPPEQSMAFEIDHADVSTCSFSAELLEDTARSVFDLDEIMTIREAVTPRDSAQAWLWNQGVEAYRRRVLDDPAVYGNDLLREEASRFLVVSAISTFGLVTEPIRRAPEGAAVRRAISYIDDHLQSPLTVADIANAARLSERGLTEAFRRERDQTPMGYVRVARLTGAHKELIRADPTQGHTVTSIAAAWGFTNSGRFAAHYRDLFGETPRSTLSG